ncbi:MAG: radical SAM protein [Nitrospirota bacterium]|nr:MAG: radical SAM protein [Nitrospirota bacterium]
MKESNLPSLRDPESILLISCYELGHQPLGIAQPMGFLKQAGYAPMSLDLSVEPLEKMRISPVQFIGISVPMHTALRLGFQVAQTLRRLKPTIHLCFYGLYASLNDQYLLEQVADSVIGGEFETPLLTLLERLEQQRIGKIEEHEGSHTQPAPLSWTKGIPGVSTRNNLVPPLLKRQPFEPEHQISSQSERAPFAVPFRATLPSLDKYAKLDYRDSQHIVGNVETSRGCLHTCLHCPIVPVYKGRFLVIPEKVVLEDIQQQVQLGAAHITFGDADFLNGPRHSLNILRNMHKEFPQLTFDFTTKIEHIIKHRDQFTEFAELGCLFVISAVESFSDTVLLHLEKGHTREDIFTALQILKDTGMTLRPSLVAFTPWTSLEDYLEMFDLVEHHDLIDAIDPVQFTVRLLVPPGSALLTPPPAHPHPIQQFIRDLDRSKFQYLWKHPDERMDALYERVMAVVEEDSKMRAPVEKTFFRLSKLAHEVAGIPYHGISSATRHPVRRPKPPRLTEPWFCCAEPTKQQFEPLHIKGQEVREV